MQIDAGGRSQGKLTYGQADEFGRARAGVVQQEEQGAIPNGEPSLARHVGEKRLDLVTFEITGLRRLRSLRRDGCDPLGLAKQFRRLRPDIDEERVQHRQPMVPRSDAIAALGFEMGEEFPHVVRSEVGQRQLADRPMGRLGEEEEKQPDSVAVAANGGLREPFLCFEMVLEELVDQAADGRHGRAPIDIGAANVWKRSAATSINSAVMVKYTAVEAGSTCPMKVDSLSSLSAGLPPSRYHRSNRPTAKLWRRSCTCGGVPPGGVGTFSCGASAWNTWLIVPGFTGRPRVNEKTGASAVNPGARTVRMLMKADRRFVRRGPMGTSLDLENSVSRIVRMPRSRSTSPHRKRAASPTRRPRPNSKLNIVA